MRRDPRALLWDIARAAEAIEQFTSGVDLAEYTASPLVHSAVERKFEIIGEALGQLRKAAPDLAARVPEAAQIVAFRNLLIHGYAVVEHARVWRTVHESLPALRQAVEGMLEELGQA